MDPNVDPRWEAFVRSHPESTVYHHPMWLAVLNAEYGHRAAHLACLDHQNQLLGVLPLVYTRGVPLLRSPVTRRRLSSLPRTPVAGPLTNGPAATNALLGEAARRVREEPGLLLEVKLREPWPDDIALGVEMSPWRTSYVLELPDRREAVRFGNSRNHTRINSGVKKARQLGVTVRAAETLDDLKEWYGLYLETMRTHFVPPRPFRLFEAMWNLLRERNMMKLLLACRNDGAGRPTMLAGSVLLMSGNTVFYAFNGRGRDHLWMRPNDVIQWEAVHQAAADGFRYYDLGEVAANNPGLAAFKSKWGSRPNQLHRFYYPHLPASDPPTPSPGMTRKLVESAWERVPRAVTAAVGQQIYRYL